MTTLNAADFNALAMAMGPTSPAAADIDALLGGANFTGDVTVSANVATVQATKLTSAELTAIVTDSGTKTLVAATANARIIVGVVTVTTTFANGDGAQPTLAIGQTSATTKFAATARFTGATATTTFAFAGTLTANTALLATQVAGTGTTETGAYTIDVHVVG